MLRWFLAASFLAVVSIPVVASCDAEIAESCLSGPCLLPSTGSNATATTTTTATTSTTTGGDGGMGTGGAPLDAKNCPTIPKTGDFPCEVFEVVHSVCHKCHINPPQNGAPFPLLTYADTQQPFPALIGESCTTDADCGPTPGNCVMGGVCKGLRFQQMFISIGPNGCPQMPFNEGMLPEPEYSTLHDWLGQCAPPVPSGTGCGCPGMGCD